MCAYVWSPAPVVKENQETLEKWPTPSLAEGTWDTPRPPHHRPAPRPQPALLPRVRGLFSTPRQRLLRIAPFPQPPSSKNMPATWPGTNPRTQHPVCNQLRGASRFCAHHEMFPQQNKINISKGADAFSNFWAPHDLALGSPGEGRSARPLAERTRRPLRRAAGDRGACSPPGDACAPAATGATVFPLHAQAHACAHATALSHTSGKPPTAVLTGCPPGPAPHEDRDMLTDMGGQRQKHTAPQPPVLPAGVTHAPGRGLALPPPAAPRGIPTELPTGLPTRSPTRTAPQAGDRHLQDLPRAGSFPDVPSHLGAPASLSSPSILPVCLSVWCQDGREEMKVRSAHGGASVRRAPSMQLGLWALPTPLGAAGNSHQGVEPTGRPRRPGQLCNARAPPTNSQPGTRTWQGHPHSFLSPFPLGLLFRAGCGLTRGNQIGEREGGAAGSWVG